MRYQGYEIRRELLAYKADEHIKSLFVLLEHIDWSTGRKEATSFNHMKNWLKQLCSKYNLEWEHMKAAVEVGVQKGWFNLENQGRVLSLGNKPESVLIDTPAPVQTGYNAETHNTSEDISEWKTPLTRANVRDLTECPKCGAAKGDMCFGNKKQTNNREMNHQPRYTEACRILRVARGEE